MYTEDWGTKICTSSIFLKFIYSEKATKFCEISILLMSCVVPVKSKVEISQNFVAFSEYMNFICNPERIISRLFIKKNRKGVKLYFSVYIINMRHLKRECPKVAFLYLRFYNFWTLNLLQPINPIHPTKSLSRAVRQKPQGYF